MLKDQDFLVVHDLNLAASTDGDGRADETSCAAAIRLHLRQHGNCDDARNRPC